MTARRRWALPLVPLYAAGLAAKSALRRSHVLSTQALQWPVVSIGSLAAGGAGKTPVVIALAELLRDRGWHVDVLSRGYGRDGTAIEQVDPTVLSPARRFGDEPTLIAQRTSVPVWVGARRFLAGQKAEAQTPAQPRRIHLLDDGFQHRQLARAVDIVLVTAEDLADRLLPAGNLREPFAALRRAHIVIVREDERAQVESRLRTIISGTTPIWTIHRELQLPSDAATNRRPLCFCAIARPEGFWAMLAAAGCKVLERHAFGDHYSYELADMEMLARIAGGLGASGFVTTEKDAVKLTPSMLDLLQRTGLVTVARLNVAFADPATVLRDLDERLA